MSRLISISSFRVAFLLILLAALILIQGRVVAQQRSVSQTPSAGGLDPAAEFKRDVAGGASFTLRFRRTGLDAKAEAVAEVAVRGQTLLVRVRADKLPSPSRWKEQRYSLWAYLPNYGQNVYLGDLPVTFSSGANESHPLMRGTSDSIFRFQALPRDAIFGGLILTAEPARFGPIINEPLRPVLLALTSNEEFKKDAQTPLLSATWSDAPSRSSTALTTAPVATITDSGAPKRAAIVAKTMTENSANTLVEKPQPGRTVDLSSSESADDAPRTAEDQKSVLTVTGDQPANSTPRQSASLRAMPTPARKGNGVACTLSLSASSLTLSSDGGTATIMVNPGALSSTAGITFTNPHWSNIAVFPEPQTAQDNGSVRYSIYSLSRTAGAYTVIFKSPCGTKEVAVVVR